MKNRGSIMLLVIVFGAVFFMVLVALSGYVLAENRAEDAARGRAEAFSIAEAGLEYYRWFLTHFPGNTTNGTGLPGPYSISYADPEGGTAGAYTLSIAANTACGTTTSLTITSTGDPSDSNQTSTLVATYAYPSVGEYSYILNTNAWFTSTIYGPMHTNGGLRMDGNPNAPVSSSLSSFTCDSSLGCSPSATEPGVFGTGSNQNLWEYPTPQVDFAGISTDFSTLKSIANTSGIYRARVSTSSNPHLGYHLIFNGTTVTIKKVTAVSSSLQSIPVDGSSSTFVTDNNLISTETTLGTYSIPSTCGLIFIEDNVWVEGTISGKVTLVAANVTTANVYPNIVVPNSIVYAGTGSDGLTAIAANDVLIGPNSPDSLTMDGIFIAQNGAFGRNLYDCHAGSGTYANKSTLAIQGSIVSALKPGTYWTYTESGCGTGVTSGYASRTTSFDKVNAESPPPFTPSISKQGEFTSWEQEN